MSGHRLLLLWLVYLAFDLADPLLPGAFSFEVSDSEIEQSIHVRRYPEDRQKLAARATAPACRVEPQDDSLTGHHLAIRQQPPRDPPPPPWAPRSTLFATAPSPEEH